MPFGKVPPASGLSPVKANLCTGRRLPIRQLSVGGLILVASQNETNRYGIQILITTQDTATEGGDGWNSRSRKVSVEK